MLMVPDLKVYLANFHTDMRRSYDGLALLVKQEMGKDIFTGDLFVFMSRRGDRVKALYWDRNGFCIWSKRLEKGSFRRPKVLGKVASMRLNELTLLLEGIELVHPQRLLAV
jgi:transposase